MESEMEVEEILRGVQARIAEACAKAGRSPDSVEIIGSGIAHDGADATAMLRASPTAHGGCLVSVEGGVDYDAREVLGEQACARRHVRHRPGRRQVVT